MTLTERERALPADPTALDAEVIRGDASKPPRRLALWAAIGWIAFIGLAALFADWLPLHRYDSIVQGSTPREPPRLALQEPLGTDALGRSVLSRAIYGARQSLLIGVLSTVIAMTVGTVLGTVAGYLRGWVDEITSIFVDVLLAFPALVLLLAIAAVGRRDLLWLSIGLSFVGIPTFARLARGSTLALAERESIVAARVMGASHRRIVTRELLPSVVLSLSAFAFIFMATVIVIEGALAFLGLGVPPPRPTWGGMVSAGRPFLQSQPYLTFIPAALLIFTVLSFMVVGEHGRRRFDVKESGLK